MELFNRFTDWVAEKEYRYWIVQYILTVIVFLCACLTIASFFAFMV
jgi:hypothetical protein